MQVFDYRNDVILAETCREDVNKFCKKVEKGTHWYLPCHGRCRTGQSCCCLHAFAAIDGSILVCRRGPRA